jgi:hypothetical protein
MKDAQPAAPKFSIGQNVAYYDHHNRAQIGLVRRIEATWDDGFAPYLIYTISHPTYRGQKIYCEESKLRVTIRKVQQS